MEHYTWRIVVTLSLSSTWCGRISYHHLHPEYILQRFKQLEQKYEHRILILHLDLTVPFSLLLLTPPVRANKGDLLACEI